MSVDQSYTAAPQHLDFLDGTRLINPALPGFAIRTSYDTLPVLVIFMILLIVDVTFHVLRWSSRDASTSSAVVTIVKHHLIKAIETTEQLLIEFSQLASAKHAKYAEFVITNDRLYKENVDLKEKNAYLTSVLASMNNDMKANAFTGFRERLLLTNGVWQRDKEIKNLRANLESTKKAIRENAFAAFCDRLVLTNKVWKQEKEIDDLHTGGERMMRERMAGIKRIAARMVLDVRKENLIEELVKDLIEEVEASKREFAMLQSAHRREIEEINNEWIKDYRKLVREVEKLRLGQQTKLVEQEVANELEQSLFDSLRSSNRKTEDLEDRLWECQKLILTTPMLNRPFAGACGSRANIGNYIFDDDLDRSLSDASTSSTCVTAESVDVMFGDSGLLSATATPKRLPKVFAFNLAPFARANPGQSLKMKSNAARVRTTSGQSLTRCKRNASVSSRLPRRASRVNSNDAPVSTGLDFAGRLAKRAEIDSGG